MGLASLMKLHMAWSQLHDSLEKAALWRQCGVLSCEVMGRKGCMGRTQSVFRARKLFCVLPRWWKHIIIHFYKFMGCMSPRGHILGALASEWKMCLGRLCDYIRPTTLWSILIMEKSMHVRKQKKLRTALHLLLDFSESTQALKECTGKNSRNINRTVSLSSCH